MRKCIDLESQPGFQQIYSTVLQQAIDRGLEGHSGDPKNIDWGYNLPIPGTKPTKGGPKPKKTQKDPPKVVVKDPAKLGTGNQFWESLFDNYITQDARKVVNRFPTPIIKGVSGWDGYHQAGAGEWGTVVSSHNHEGRAFIFTHEYWHALDNIIDLASNPDSTGLHMQSSLRLVPSMEKDAKRLGLSFNEKVYYKYLEDNGINFKVDPSGNRTIRIKKGSNRQQAEEQMYPGDHWRIMEQMLRQSKKDLHKANATKDPVKMARAKKLHEDIGALYDKHIARLETIRKIKKEAAVIHRKLKQTSQPEQGYNHLFSALGDIFDALTDGRVQDWEYANEVWMSDKGVISTFGRHGSGYYNMSRQSDYGKQTSSPRNYNLDGAMRSKRAETWAEWGSMWASHDNTMQAFASKILPSIAKQFDAEMKRALTIKVIADLNKIPNASTQNAENQIDSIMANPRTIETTLITRPEDIKPDTIMYHITDSKNVGNVLKYGLTTKNKAVNSRLMGQMGSGYRKATKIFAWSDFNSAQRYAARSHWDKDVTIIAFKSGNQTWVKDELEKFEQTAFKTPRKKKGSKPAHIPPKNITGYRKIDKGDTLNVMLRGDAQARGGGLFTRQVNEGKIPHWKNVKSRTTF